MNIYSTVHKSFLYIKLNQIKLCGLSWELKVNCDRLYASDTFFKWYFMYQPHGRSLCLKKILRNLTGTENRLKITDKNYSSRLL